MSKTILEKLNNNTTTPADKLSLSLEQFTKNHNSISDYGNAIFTTEGYSDGDLSKGELHRSLASMEELFDTMIAQHQIENETTYTQEQIDAAKTAIVGFYDPKGVLEGTSSPIIAADQHTQVVQSGIFGNGEPNVGRSSNMINYITESFNNAENRETMKTQISYNLRAARQNEFGEAFYPTIIVPPNTAGITITVDLISIMEDKKRSLDGTFEYMWNQKNLVNAIVDPSILNNDTTRIYPIYDEQKKKSLDFFVNKTDVKPKTIVLENGESVTTAPLAVGKEFDLLGLGSADWLVGQNRLDTTDQIDPNVQLSAIYVKLKDGKVFSINNLTVSPESNFVKAVAGNHRLMQLDFDNRWVRIDSNMTTVSGDELFPDSPISQGNVVVHLHVAMSGKVNLNTAVTNVNANLFNVEAVFDTASKDKLDLEKDEQAKKVAKLFEDAKIIGYDLIARRINTNRRERGQIVQVQQERIVYTLPTLAPVTALIEIGDKTVDENACLTTLVTTTYIRCSNAAVATLLNEEKHLASYISNDNFNPSLLYKSQALGAARFFLTPHYRHIKLDVAQELNTLRSSERVLDVQGVLVNTIRELVYDGYLKSNYKAVADVLQGENANKKPLVIIGTDPYIAAYLQVPGDVRTLGDEFDVKVVTTPDLRVRGRVFLAFGKSNPSASDVANPMHHGNCAWRAEWISSLDINRNGAIAHEKTVQPSFLHIPHQPVLMTMQVLNLPQAVTKMSPVFTQAA